MAKEQQKQRNPVDEEEDIIAGKVDAYNRKIEEARRLKAIETSKNNFNAKIQKLQERAADFVIKYGKEDYRSQIMLTFLNVAIEMRDAIELTNDIGTAMSCITEAITCMDDILQENMFQIEGTLTTKYGFWERRRRKKQLKKAISNNAGRMKQICDMLIGNQQMATAIVNSLRASSIQMQKMMQKNNEKQKKINMKNSGGAPLPPSEGEKIVDGIIAARGAQPAATRQDGSASDSQTPSGGGTQEGGAGGGVDISDI